MANSVKSSKIWENSNDTPLSASNLSKLVDFQARDKFIHLTNEPEDREKWADFVIDADNFPPDTQIVEAEENYLNSIVYNKRTGIAKKAVYDLAASREKWVPQRDTNNHAVANRILKINKDVQISMYYVDATSEKRVYLSFDFGNEDQLLSFDDVIRRNDSFENFNISTTYFIYLIHKWSDGDNAYLKIVRQGDEHDDYWYNISNGMSPTNSEVIAYRKIGGFRTDSAGEIIESSIWDLFTYKRETTVDSINIFENGFSRELNSSDIKIKNEFDLFNTENIEGALEETRYLVDNIRDQFYTNRRYGVNLRYTPFVKEDDKLVEAGINTLCLLISPGIIDVANSQKEIDEPVFLNEVGVGLKIYDADKHNGETYNIDDKVILGNGLGQLKEGVWRVLLDSTPEITNGNIILRHEDAEKPKLDLKTQAWFDNNRNRCIGKFKIKKTTGSETFYVEKMSVTDTFDQNAVPNSIHIHHGTLVPDGLLLCDGKWHDVMGIDENTYTYQQLLSIKGGEWGESWYEETPNLYDRFLKMPPEEYVHMNLGEKFTLPVGEEGVTLGGSADCGRAEGTLTHNHELPHTHGTGNISISSSGQHNSHNIIFNDSSPDVFVEPTFDGTKVAVDDHNHNVNIEGGEHYHPAESINGEVSRLEGSDAETTFTDVLPPYKEVLICIKK